MRRHLIWVLGFLLGLPGMAQSALVLNQPLFMVDGRSSHVVNGTGFIVYDRIELAQTMQVESLTWVGAFIDVRPDAVNPVAHPATTWHFQVLNDASGGPGSVTDSSSVLSADVTANLLGQATLSGRLVDVYRFAATLLDPLLIVGGGPQWFGLFSENDAADPRFAWFSGTGGDGLSRQIFQPGQTFTDYVDRAMRLEGSAVPEPPTWLLVALVLGAVAGRSRRRGRPISRQRT